MLKDTGADGKKKSDIEILIERIQKIKEEIEKQIKALKPDVTEKINLSLEEIFMQEMKGEDYDYKSILN